jgi:hypothetical protein
MTGMADRYDFAVDLAVEAGMRALRMPHGLERADDIHGTTRWSVSLAYMCRGVIEIGVLYAPVGDWSAHLEVIHPQ